MALQFATVQLTQLQLSHAIVAVQDYMKALLVAAETDPQGGEHEDYLVAQSILKALAAAKE